MERTGAKGEQVSRERRRPGYILLGIWFEERDLVTQFGERYRRYRDQVGMLLPFKKLPASPRDGESLR
jgi:hypothetical protein